MSNSNAELKEQVEELYNYLCIEENGNEWEQDFMLSIWKQFIEQGRSLSAKQLEKIEELHDEKLVVEEEDDDDGDFPF